MSRYVSILYALLFSLNVVLGVGGGGIVLCFGHADSQCATESLVQETNTYQGCADDEAHIHEGQLEDCYCSDNYPRPADVAAFVRPGTKPCVALAFERVHAVVITDPTNESRWRTSRTMRDDPGGEQRLTLVRSTRLLI
ncbi:MAG: hypothetical protein Q9O74_01945 [Planctomycetota bacterium]|nr:hypothetical protein [Planctomycetota bacterium]